MQEKKCGERKKEGADAVVGNDEGEGNPSRVAERERGWENREERDGGRSAGMCTVSRKTEQEGRMTHGSAGNVFCYRIKERVGKTTEGGRGRTEKRWCGKRKSGTGRYRKEGDEPGGKANRGKETA